jgi:hypothetical protein
VAKDLRKEGLSAEAARMESAFRRTLEKRAPPVMPKMVPAPQLSAVRELEFAAITWVKQMVRARRRQIVAVTILAEPRKPAA